MAESGKDNQDINEIQRKKTLARIFGLAIIDRNARETLLSGKMPQFFDNVKDPSSDDPESNLKGLTDKDKEILKNGAENIQDLANSILNQ